MCDQQIEFKRCPWALKKRFVKSIHITSQINNVFTPFLLFFFPEAYFFSCRELSFNLLLFFKNKTIQCNQPNKIWTNWYKMQNEEPTGFYFFPSEAGPVLHYLLRKQIIVMLFLPNKINGDDYSFLLSSPAYMGFKVGYYKQIWAYTRFIISTAYNEAVSLCHLCLRKSKYLPRQKIVYVCFPYSHFYKNIKVRMGIKGNHICSGIYFYYRHCFVCFTCII